MRVLSPRLVLCADPPALIELITIGGHSVRIHDGHPGIYDIAGYPAAEYRSDTGHVTVLIRVASAVLPGGAPGCVVVAYVPSDAVDGDNPTFDAAIVTPELSALIVKSWSVELVGEVCRWPSLADDPSEDAAAARAAWPWAQPRDGGGTPIPYLPTQLRLFT